MISSIIKSGMKRCLGRQRVRERLSLQEQTAAMVHELDEGPDIDIQTQRIGGIISNKRHDLVPGESGVSELREDAGKEGTHRQRAVKET
jgi:hypothetical protein